MVFAASSDPVPFDVTFNANKGQFSGGENILKETYEGGAQTVNFPEEPTREFSQGFLYAFKGWFTRSSGGNEVTEDTEVTKKMTIYAQWDVSEPEYTYSWSTGEYGVCRETSTQTRTVTCMRDDDEETFPDSYCTGTKPATYKSCTYTPQPSPSCSQKPEYLNDFNARFTTGNPTKVNQSWQNNSSSLACYYVCQRGYTGNNCVEAPSPQVNGSCDKNIKYGCISGRVNSNNIDVGICGERVTWVCEGLNGGSSAQCSAVNDACMPNPIDGSCNNNVQFGCTMGTSSSNVAGSCGGNVTWTCKGINGGVSVSCKKANSACAAPVNGSCNGNTQFACNVGLSINQTPGSCGGNATWTCAGSNGGTNASCTKANAACTPTPTNGSCNTSVKFGCTTGTSLSNQAGSCGGNATWTCAGGNGGTSVSCSKANSACPPPQVYCAAKPSYLSDNNATFVENPISVNQPWVQGATSCGYTCRTGFSGMMCALPTGEEIGMRVVTPDGVLVHGARIRLFKLSTGSMDKGTFITDSQGYIREFLWEDSFSEGGWDYGNGG